MRHAIYFAVKCRVKNEFLARCITTIIHGLYTVRFAIRAMFTKSKKTELMTEEKALRIISEQYPFKEVKDEIVNQPIHEDLDCSVIIPIYNHEDIIEKCIDSAINQNCSYSYEIILVDDGSNEAAKAILKKYEVNEKCRVIYQENKGIAGARNTGINNAFGKYMMFIDCDDVIEPDMLQKLLASAYENDSDIAFGGYRLIKEKDGQAYSVKDYAYNEWIINTHSSENNVMGFPGYPWGKVYKRELWANIRFLPGYLYEDSIIQFLLHRECKRYSFTEEVFYNYKWYEKNFSKTQNSAANPRGVQRYWMLLIMLEKSKELGLPEDETFYITLLRHLGDHYKVNIKDFEESVKIAMFSLACGLLKKYKKDAPIKLTYAEKKLEESLIEGNYPLWELACDMQ